MLEEVTFRNLLRYVVLGGGVFFMMSSCATVKPAPPTPPQLEYFQSKDSNYPALLQMATPPVSRIRVGDILGVIVSSLNKESNEIMNFYNVSSLPLASFSPGGGSGGGGNSQPLGYPVDSLGFVSIPLIGKQKLDGLTIQQAEMKIRTEVNKTLKDPAVNIRFMNHKFTVLGEVSSVGIYNLLNDYTTIIEAITAAGDLTIFGKRDSIKVIRTVNDRREMGVVSLRNRDVFSSPYFYVRNDDIIYVEPTKDKVIPQPPQPQEQPSKFVQRTPFYLSLLTTLISLGYLFFEISVLLCINEPTAIENVCASINRLHDLMDEISLGSRNYL
jgi:polysaccharide export outer membrane protein